MTPSPLHGLNVVHSPQQNAYASDSQDLLSAPPFPDLSAQLDLWTNLTFESDEPLVKGDANEKREGSGGASEDRDEDGEGEGEGVASADGHANVVNPASSSTGTAQQPPFDLSAILAGYGIDPFLVPPVQPTYSSSQAASLAQLLSSYPMPPAQQQHYNENENSSAGPPAKRTRTRKSSTASNLSRDTTVPPGYDDKPDPSLSPAEDKRRRNTAASARFRLKKKEREVALESKSKELEVRVNELERECEGLRRENGWLKGLVVGVTGASAAPTPQSTAGAGTKRRREDAVESARGVVAGA